ncbi:hypothetical protein IR083_17650 [Dysgonomonas sp. GY75]|uniref:hypothetical protein n=1 Tax=Dysgonomonas sp. GY75 TaxID=2780419 RepID=UPI001883717D|nr:hypothetical protein [Dysgonomonas sp. GY75]MBF0650650.1 hypothetical protein [Dysgonomonas sp. GY75]
MNSVNDIKTDSKYSFWIFLSLLFALSLFMVCWFGPVSAYAGHDYFFNIGRFNVLIDALKSGNYPIYLDYNALEGYGYFTKGFYPDLIILPFAALGILTGTIAAYNVMIFTMTFLCGLLTYIAVNTVFRNTFVASVSAILYTFSAYHLFDWYNRAALGESLSFTFLPVIFLGLYHIIKGDYRKWYLLTIGYSLLIYTHLLSSFLTFITLALIVIICYKPLIKEPKRIGYLALAAIITLPIVSSYILTLLEQMTSNTFYYSTKENITGQTKLGLQDLGWGFLSGILYPKTENMAGTGPLLFLLVLLRLFVKEKNSSVKVADFCLLTGIILLVIASAVFPWGRLPLGFIQFPWRLYEFIIFFFAIGGAYYLSVIVRNRKQQIVAGSVIVLFTLITFIVNNNNYKYWQSLAISEAPHWFTGVASVDNEYYLGGLEYLPVNVPSHHYIHERGDIVISKNEETVISNFTRKEGVTSFDIDIKNPSKLELPLVYYKGYEASYLDKKNGMPVTESENGLVQIEAGKSGQIEVVYRWTATQQYSWYISILSTIGLIIYIFVSNRKRSDVNK